MENRERKKEIYRERERGKEIDREMERDRKRERFDKFSRTILHRVKLMVFLGSSFSQKKKYKYHLDLFYFFSFFYSFG